MVYIMTSSFTRKNKKKWKYEDPNDIPYVLMSVDADWQPQTEKRWNDNFQFIGPFKLILQYPRGSWLITPVLKNHFNP